MLPHLPRLDGTDTHVYFGWYHGDVRDIDRLARTVPRMVRFVSEFGAQAVPETTDFIDEDAWPDLDWELLHERHALQKWVFDERVPPAEFDSFAAWRRATQVYQAELIKHHVELLRRIKYRPAGGFCMFAFNDPAPVVSFSVLDHERVPKLGWEALRLACRPVIVVADRPPAIVTAGDEIGLDVHVVSDLRAPIEGAEIEVVASWPAGRREWRFGGDIAADEVTRVGRIEFRRPRHARRAHARVEAHRRERHHHQPIRRRDHPARRSRERHRDIRRRHRSPTSLASAPWERSR